MSTLAAKPLYSILYDQERWMWPEMHSIFLRFKANGRGEIWWVIDASLIIIATFDWTITARLAASEETSRQTQARLIGSFDLMMKLNEEDPRGCAYYNWRYTSGAYEAKQFKITIEQGNFRSSMRAGEEVEDLRRASGSEKWGFDEHGRRRRRAPDWSNWFVPEDEDIAKRWRYAYRLVFDKSPYPTIEHWVRPFDRRIAYTDPETKVEFVAQRLPISENGEPAMNKAWQQEMVRVWEARPPNDEIKRMMIELRERRMKIHRAERAREAIKRAELKRAQEQAETVQHKDEAQPEENIDRAKIDERSV